MPRIRAFIAVNLSLPTIRAVGDFQKSLRQSLGQGAPITWVPTANLHLTLKFLGDIEAETAEAIGDVLGRRVANRSPFEVRARGAGAFPDPQRPRVLWVGLEDNAGALVTLAADVERWMEDLGHPREVRPFTPHLTLGRVKDRGGHAPDVTTHLLPAADTTFGTCLVH